MKQWRRGCLLVQGDSLHGCQFHAKGGEEGQVHVYSLSSEKQSPVHPPSCTEDGKCNLHLEARCPAETKCFPTLCESPHCPLGADVGPPSTLIWVTPTHRSRIGQPLGINSAPLSDMKMSLLFLSGTFPVFLLTQHLNLVLIYDLHILMCLGGTYNVPCDKEAKNARYTLYVSLQLEPRYLV